MILRFPFLLALAFSATAVANDSPAPLANEIRVNVDAEAASLSRGFGLVSAQLNRPPISLVFTRGERDYVLEDVRSLRAADGVVVVEVGKGVLYVLNPKDILYVTDGKVLAPRFFPTPPQARP